MADQRETANWLANAARSVLADPDALRSVDWEPGTQVFYLHPVVGRQLYPVVVRECVIARDAEALRVVLTRKGWPTREFAEVIDDAEFVALNGGTVRP
jgi:hypothetical protein